MATWKLNRATVDASPVIHKEKVSVMVRRRDKTTSFSFNLMEEKIKRSGKLQKAFKYSRGKIFMSKYLIGY